MSKANRIIFVLGLFLIALVVSNPSERAYLNKIGEEYGSIHHGTQFTPGYLLAIGKGDRMNLIFLSNYKYEFGNISVEYFGVCGMIFKTGSSNDSLKIEESQPQKVIV
ncbi:hypothetical protein HZR84_03500 [Hyphobacterium sp. CCMP332]|nr:hypothetical protein HZR84_03500 [Hyphobacterium sp. CCMP332]